MALSMGNWGYFTPKSGVLTLLIISVRGAPDKFDAFRHDNTFHPWNDQKKKLRGDRNGYISSVKASLFSWTEVASNAVWVAHIRWKIVALLRYMKRCPFQIPII